MSLKKINDSQYGSFEINLDTGFLSYSQMISPYSCNILRILLCSNVNIPISDSVYFNIMIFNNGFNGEKNILVASLSNYQYDINPKAIESYKFVNFDVFSSLIGKGEILSYNYHVVNDNPPLGFGSPLYVIELEQI